MKASPYSRTRNKQLVRVLRLLARLEAGWCSLDALSQELSVSTRTIRRDLAAIEEAHLPVRKGRHEDVRIAYWRIARKTA